jgi:hypothetical protein
MSSSLCWAPPPSEVKDHHIDLKWEIGKYFDEQYNGDSIEIEVDKSFIPFLKGIIAGGSVNKAKAATELIVAINKYGRVQLYTKS